MFVYCNDDDRLFGIGFEDFAQHQGADFALAVGEYEGFVAGGHRRAGHEHAGGAGGEVNQAIPAFFPAQNAARFGGEVEHNLLLNASGHGGRIGVGGGQIRGEACENREYVVNANELPPRHCGLAKFLTTRKFSHNSLRSPLPETSNLRYLHTPGENISGFGNRFAVVLGESVRLT